MRQLLNWKRNGVAGCYIVEVLEVKGLKVKIKPLWHGLAKFEDARPRWVRESRLRELSPYDRATIEREGL